MYPEYKPSVFMVYYITAVKAKISAYSTYYSVYTISDECMQYIQRIAAISEYFYIEL
jgi:hypothetical protein